MRKRCVRVEASIFHLVDSVHTVREELCFDAFKLVAGYDGLELNAELGSKRAVISSRLTSATLPSSYSQYTIKLFCSAIIVELFYPIVWLTISSLIKSSSSWSLLPTQRASLAVKTTFSMLFTFVGEPLRPHCSRSAST